MGSTQSYFLREFIDEIVRTGGAALAGSGPPPTREAVEQIFKDVALGAAHRMFGDRTPIEVTLSEPLGEVCFAQVLEVALAPEDPRRQIPLDVVRAAGREVAAGDVVEVPILYTWATKERAAIERLQAELGAELPLPLHSLELWEHLTEALNAALLRYFPAPALPADTLGGLLVGGGGWARGCSARSGEWEIELAGAMFEFYRTRVTSGWVDYGFTTIVRRGGVGVFRGQTNAWKQLGEGDGAVHLTALIRGDNDGVVRSWAGLATSEAARPRFVAALQAIAERLAADELNGSETHELLVAAIRPPVAGGLWVWMQEALPRLLGPFQHTVEHEGVKIRYEVLEVYPPDVGLIYFGSAAVRMIGRTSDVKVLPCPEGEPIQMGYVGPEALTLRGPTAEEARDLEAIVAKFGEWLAVHLDHHVENRGFEGIEYGSYFYGFDGYFPLVQLLEQRLRWGPAGAPPVPAFDEAALARAAELLRPADADGDHVLAAFAVGGWTIVLHDDMDNLPFGSYCGVSLTPPEGGGAVQVMMVDAWNPATRSVIDGDAFAFQRFSAWLRAAIVRADLDEVRVFHEEVDEEEEEEEVDEGEDEDYEEGGVVSGEIEVSLAEWLLFGLPDHGDRFLVDWRAQWHVVNAIRGIDGFAGIYGFTGESVERLRTRDLACWRRFLREVIDPRFARTTGERLLNPA